MLTVHHGNRMENLAQSLAEVVREPAAGPMTAETVVVQSPGMARWLTMRLADAHGIATGLDFPRPARFLWSVYRAVVPDVPERSSFDKPVLTWRLTAMLGDPELPSRFPDLHAYLEDGDGLRRYELAARIADTFDAYLVYRPDWIAAWEAGREVGGLPEAARWQADLWRDLAADGPAHRTGVHTRFLEVLGHDPEAATSLPVRVSLFGIPAMPPAYLEAFARIALHVEVHLFLMNPCREYWGDIVSSKDAARRAAATGRSAETLLFDTGHALLSSLGKQGRDFIDAVQDVDAGEEQEFRSPVEDPGPPSTLRVLQDDILSLRNRGRAPQHDEPDRNRAEPWTVMPDDDSIQVHACHGPMREIEVLHDRLLAWLDAGQGGEGTLTPSDVVVMTPDIDLYAPFIEAVFGSAPEPQRIPYSIADRALLSESPVVEAFFDLLDLPSSRFEVDRVVALLEVPAIRRRFGIDSDDLPGVRRWLRETGIRWEIDAASRETLGVPPTAGNTWRAGLDRLLLGYALPALGLRTFEGILPYDDVEGGSARMMGRFQEFAETCFALRPRLAEHREPSEWMVILRTVLDDFLELAGDEEQSALQAVRTALHDLAVDAGTAGASTPVPLDVVRTDLLARLQSGESVGRFMTGGVTFCAMVPMRSIPFEVVCLVGLDADRYPRGDRTYGFDLMESDTRRGDRSRRDEDRYLFLEAILSARRTLYLSYVGNNIRDNTVIPPSVLVAEMLDHLAEAFPLDGGTPEIDDPRVTRHPLQAFSRRYVDGSDPRLFTYRSEFADDRGGPRRGSCDPEPFLGAELPEPGDEWLDLDVEDLARFFGNPANVLLRGRLGILLPGAEESPEPREPFALVGLERFEVRQQMLTLIRAGVSEDDAREILAASGALPHGRVGEAVFAQQYATVDAFAERVDRTLGAGDSRDVDVDLQTGGVRIRGSLPDVLPTGLVSWRLAKTRAADRIGVWIRHLVLNVAVHEGVIPWSTWVAEDVSFRLRPVDNASEALGSLVRRYREGLRRPLRFFPETSYRLVRSARSSQSRKPPRDAALECWTTTEYRRGEGDDPAIDVLFRGLDPLGDPFEELAHEIFGPFLDHIEEGGR